MKNQKSDPSLDQATLRLGWNLEKLHSIVASQVFHRAATIFGGELSLPRVIALFHLAHRGPQTITDIAEAVALSHAATSRMVDSLVKMGLVDRQEGSEDRRRKRILLNAAGLDCIRMFRAVTAEAYAKLFVDLPKGDRAVLGSVLAELTDRLPDMSAEQ